MRLMSLKSCVLFILLCGSFTMAAYGGPTMTGNLTGEWGGEHIRLVVKETRASAEFDCAFGETDEPIHPDKDGKFEARGIYMFERGGPIRAGAPPLKRHAALFRGWTDGKEMRLTVVLVDTGREVGNFSLSLGRRASLDKCL